MSGAGGSGSPRLTDKDYVCFAPGNRGPGATAAQSLLGPGLSSHQAARRAVRVTSRRVGHGDRSSLFDSAGPRRRGSPNGDGGVRRRPEGRRKHSPARLTHLLLPLIDEAAALDAGVTSPQEHS